MTPFWVPLVTTIVGIVLGAWFNNFIKRPKLAVVGMGGGGGPGPGYHQCQLRIENRPGFLGVNIPPTIVFGKQIHPRLERGLPVERSRARQCQAWLCEGNQPVKLLWWQALDNSSRVRWVDLESGDGAVLFVFARRDDEPSKYFVYEPESPTVASPQIPGEDLELSGTRDFMVRINYSFGRQRLDIPVRVKRDFEGRLSFVYKGGSTGF